MMSTGHRLIPMRGSGADDKLHSIQRYLCRDVLYGPEMTVMHRVKCTTENADGLDQANPAR